MEKVCRDAFDIVRELTPVGDPNECAKQSFFEQTDINCIMRRFAATGVLPQVTPGVFADISHLQHLSLAEAFERVDQARDSFMSLPAEVRALCDNDIHRYMAMIQTPEGVEALANAAGVSVPAPRAGVQFPGAGAEPQGASAASGADHTPT